MEKNNTPPGLLNQDIEFFVMNGEVQYLQDGKIHLFNEITLPVAAILRAQLDNDSKALIGLDAMKITDPYDQLRQYVFCNFGEFDKEADIEENGGMLHKEYWNCGHRETCPGHGLICKLPKVKNGKLTNHEGEIMKEIASDKTNKEIASDFGRSTFTINREVKTIAHKIGCLSKPGIAAFTASHNII
jgi:DNA-binding CsgD family transcriptional regulator